MSPVEPYSVKTRMFISRETLHEFIKILLQVAIERTLISKVSSYYKTFTSRSIMFECVYIFALQTLLNKYTTSTKLGMNVMALQTIPHDCISITEHRCYLGEISANILGVRNTTVHLL
jgi:hypothetical protein